jgi:hypothetical protein
MLIGASVTPTVRIPNAVIQSEFRKWIREDFRSRMTQDLYGSSVTLVHTMADDKFPEFAKTFGELILTMIPNASSAGSRRYTKNTSAYFFSVAHTIKVCGPPGWR